MNREEAKLVIKYGMTDEEIRILLPEFDSGVEHRNLIEALADNSLECKLIGDSPIFWKDTGLLKHFHEFDYRAKPKTQMINGIECPTGVECSSGVDHKSHEEHYFVYVENAIAEDYFTSYKWPVCNSNIDLVKRGIVHLTKENAIKCCKARLGIKD